MNRKNIFFLLIILVVIWIFYFRLKPNNFPLIFNFKQPTPVSPIYYIKKGREQIQSLFIMGNRDSTEWNFILSQKRLIEAQILCNHQLKKIGIHQLLLSQQNFNEGSRYLSNLVDIIDTNFLVQEQQKIKNLMENTCK